MMFRHALAVLAVTVAPSLAQAAPSVEPGAPRSGRSVTTTGQTKPPAGGAPPSSLSVPLPKPLTQAEMIKAQKAAEARTKAWDARMRKTMGSICGGC